MLVVSWWWWCRPVLSLVELVSLETKYWCQLIEDNEAGPGHGTDGPSLVALLMRSPRLLLLAPPAAN